MPVINNVNKLPKAISIELKQKEVHLGGIPSGSFVLTLDGSGHISSVSTVRSGTFNEIYQEAKDNESVYLIDRRSRI